MPPSDPLSSRCVVNRGVLTSRELTPSDASRFLMHLIPSIRPPTRRQPVRVGGILRKGSPQEQWLSSGSSHAHLRIDSPKVSIWCPCPERDEGSIKPSEAGKEIQKTPTATTSSPMRTHARSGPSNMSTAGLPSSPTVLGHSRWPKCSPKSTPLGGSTSTSSTDGIESTRPGFTTNSSPFAVVERLPASHKANYPDRSAGVVDLNTRGAGERSEMSNFIVKQEGPGPRVAEKVWEVRLGTGSLMLGALAGMLAGLYLGRRGGQNDPALQPKDWPVNIAHRGGAEIAPENTLEGFREGLRVGAGVLELDVHTTADGHVVVIHDDVVDRTTNSTGAVREMTPAELKRLDAGYRFTRDGGATFPFRGEGIRIPTLEEVYDEFVGVPINIEIKGERPGIEEALWRIIESAGAAGRRLDHRLRS